MSWPGPGGSPAPSSGLGRPGWSRPLGCWPSSACPSPAPFDLTQPTISHHLKVLREAGIIDSERRGTWVHYWLVPTALARMSALLSPPAR
ncbi:MAG: ArsR/SmtB family transcription factor [Streptosporangiaceae bacterium]